MNTTRLVAAVGYLAIVLALWLPFTLHSGFPYETGFIYTSEISTWWNGFLNGQDHSRIYDGIFYQTAYLMGELSGFAGSFVPFAIVYAALWWARGFLVFLIGRRLLPGYDLFWYLTGALVLMHASDETIGWAGQMNQFGYIFWMLAGFYMLVVAREQTVSWRFVACLVLAVFFEHLSLWSYESELAIVLAAPIFVLRSCPARKRLWMILAWYLVPALYGAAAILRYARPNAQVYQESVLRKTWALGSLVNDWMFNIGASLKFWRWPGTHPAAGSIDGLKPACILAVVAFAAGIILVAWVERKEGSSVVPPRRTLWILFLSGFLLLVLSFPAYLILSSARSLWRTQILSGFGAALMFTAAIALFPALTSLCENILQRSLPVAARNRRSTLSAAYTAATGGGWPRASVFTRTLTLGAKRMPWVQTGIMVLLALPIAGYGGFSALTKAAYHRSVWERHRAVMAQILTVAPRLKPGTLAILTGGRKDAGVDAFSGANLWFDLALRLAYPGDERGGRVFR